MRKKTVLLATMMLSLSLVGCGDSSEKSLSSIKPDKYVTLGDYKGIEVTLDSIEVSENEIDARIESRLQASAEKKEVTGRAVKEGDIVNIDYEGKKDGVPFEGGTAQGFDLTIGSHTFIDGFEDGLIGAKTGDTLDLNLTFPETYHSEDLAGQEVVFTVSVNSIQEEIVPELTDEAVNKIDSSVKTVAEFKEKTEKELVESKKQSAMSSAFTNAFQTAFENAEIKKVPDWLLESKINTIKSTAEQYAKNYNMELADFLTNYMGQTEEQFNADCETYGKEGAEQSLVLYAIAKAEGLMVSEEDKNAAVAYYTKLYGYSSEEEFKNNSDMDAFEEFLLKDRVAKFLLKNASVKDAAGNEVNVEEYLGVDFADSWNEPLEDTTQEAAEETSAEE